MSGRHRHRSRSPSSEGWRRSRRSRSPPPRRRDYSMERERGTPSRHRDRSPATPRVGGYPVHPSRSGHESPEIRSVDRREDRRDHRRERGSYRDEDRRERDPEPREYGRDASNRRGSHSGYDRPSSSRGYPSSRGGEERPSSRRGPDREREWERREGTRPSERRPDERPPTGGQRPEGRRFRSPEPGFERRVRPDTPRPGSRYGRGVGFPPRQAPINHNAVPPFMLRVLVKHGDWHEEGDFDTKDGSFEKTCELDEIQVYAWMDSNLRTVVELTLDVRDEDRDPQHNFHMRIVKFDEDMKPSFIPLPSVHATYRARDDNITLGDKGFIVGDLVDICVTKGKHSMPGGATLNGDNDKETKSGVSEKTEEEQPAMKEDREERRRSESDQEGDQEMAESRRSGSEEK